MYVAVSISDLINPHLPICTHSLTHTLTASSSHPTLSTTVSLIGSMWTPIATPSVVSQAQPPKQLVPSTSTRPTLPSPLITSHSSLGLSTKGRGGKEGEREGGRERGRGREGGRGRERERGREGERERERERERTFIGLALTLYIIYCPLLLLTCTHILHIHLHL